ncbi:MAG: metal ABC transporter permease [Phycisphaerales bacterium]|nr:metal ABC transporter permease [Phycisphaerales bacterium]
MDQLIRLLTLQDANTRTVLLGTTLLGVASGVVGVFAVLRKRSLVADAVAHASLPGVCVAYLVIGDRSFAGFMLGAIAMGLLAGGFIAFVRAATRTKEDAAIGLAVGGFFGLGIALSRIIQSTPGGTKAGLDGFIFGKAASMVSTDAMLIGVVAAVVLLGCGLMFKEFRMVCFDREFASGQGWPTLRIDLLLMGLVCVCTVAGLPAVGVVLMVSLIVIPAAAARFWTERLTPMVLIAGVIGGMCGLLGTALSATLPAPEGGLSRGWPTGPVITLVGTAIFVFSLLLAPERGVVAVALRRWKLRRRIASQNLLRSVYEHLERGGDLGGAWTPEVLNSASARCLPAAKRAGFVEPVGGGLVLTRAGRAAAARVVRAHRLWEMFLISGASLPTDHVDRDADEIEHHLSPELLAQLEARLAAEGRLPAGVPRSPHETTPAPRDAEVAGP